MQQKDEWEKAADAYSVPHVRKAHIRMPAFMRALGDVTGKNILDVGCGDGYYARLMAHQGARVTGVDFSETFINTAQKEELRSPLGITYLQGDIADVLPLEDKSFDAMVADMVFVTIPTQEAYGRSISEMARLLRVGGFILISKEHPANFDRQGSLTKQASPNYVVTHKEHLSYFDSLAPQHVKLKIEGKDVEWTNYHRTLEDFVNPWTTRGFAVTEIIEPKPTAEAVEQFPQDLESTAHIPYYLILKLTKTADVSNKE